MVDALKVTTRPLDGLFRRLAMAAGVSSPPQVTCFPCCIKAVMAGLEYLRGPPRADPLTLGIEHVAEVNAEEVDVMDWARRGTLPLSGEARGPPCSSDNSRRGGGGRCPQSGPIGVTDASSLRSTIAHRDLCRSPLLSVSSGRQPCCGSAARGTRFFFARAGRRGRQSRGGPQTSRDRDSRVCGLAGSFFRMRHTLDSFFKHNTYLPHPRVHRDGGQADGTKNQALEAQVSPAPFEMAFDRQARIGQHRGDRQGPTRAVETRVHLPLRGTTGSSTRRVSHPRKVAGGAHGPTSTSCRSISVRFADTNIPPP